ncbi:MAG: CPBP family intramembrane metalloprotease [Bdellovibrionales bacterium]|nr:CPBP family intramembrane metalloprotease [Bdellovibrionales bacterium]NQZ18368.1 CPBP family intramembrane metalloprotease [Bdellovibrionales bacterium]
MDYVRFDFKFPQESYIWAMNNLFLVCFAEEAFFRRYLQGGLSESLAKFKWGKYFALIVSAILFGLAHFKGGIPYVLLSSLAGLFYGWTYMKSQRLEAAILTHFGLNSIHFFFFSYPALY